MKYGHAGFLAFNDAKKGSFLHIHRQHIPEGNAVILILWKDRIAFFNDMRARLSEEAGADCQEVGPDTDGGDTMYGQHYPTHDVMLVLNNSMPTVEIMVLYKKDPAE